MLNIYNTVFKKINEDKMNMETISPKNLGDKYLYINKEYINKSLDIFFEKIIGDIYPHVKNNKIFKQYLANSSILYSNNIHIIMDKKTIREYVYNLNRYNVILDIKRMKYTKDFIDYFGGKVKNNITPNYINLENYKHIIESDIHFYSYDQVSHHKLFLKNIIKNNRYFRYLLHQDIHNSIINPILIFTMISNNYTKNNQKDILQFSNISQIYNVVNNKHINVLYVIKKFIILSSETSNIIYEKNIIPPLIIDIDLNIEENYIGINIKF